MDWLVEDQAWEQARSLLGGIPEELRTDPQFRRQRLVVLEKARLPVDALDAEWRGLLHDFPEELPVHLHRYDLLREAKRLPDAQAVLNAVHPRIRTILTIWLGWSKCVRKKKRATKQLRPYNGSSSWRRRAPPGRLTMPGKR